MSNRPSTIPVVLIGINRQTAIATTKIFEGTRYNVSAVLDFVDSPEAYRFSPHNLGVVLAALHPQAQILITGNAVDVKTCATIEPIWEAHQRNLEVISCWVALAKTFPTDGPPPPGTVEEITRQLAEAFDRSV